MRNHARKMTTAVMEAMDNGLLDPRDVADMALNWLSESDVDEMVRRNDIMPFDDEEEE